MARFDFDVLIVGSGFGGSVAALRAAEKGYRVGVMESGRRWPDAEISKTQWDLPRFLWFPAAELYGIQRIEYLGARRRRGVGLPPRPGGGPSRRRDRGMRPCSSPVTDTTPELRHDLPPDSVRRPPEAAAPSRHRPCELGPAAPPARRPAETMTRCLICSVPICDAQLETDGGSVHPACLAERLPQDAIVALLAAIGFVLADTAVVAAG